GRFFDYYVQPRTKTAGQSLTTSFDKVPQGTLGFGDRYMKVTKTASKQPYDIALQHWYAQNRNQCLVLRSTRDAHSGGSTAGHDECRIHFDTRNSKTNICRSVSPLFIRACAPLGGLRMRSPVLTGKA